MNQTPTLSPFDKAVDRLSPEQMAQYEQAVTLLKGSGVLNILKMIATPKVNPSGDVNQNAYGAAFSAGYFAALDHLQDFHHFIIDRPKPVTTGPKPTYGGIVELYRSKRINKAEFKTLTGMEAPE